MPDLDFRGPCYTADATVLPENLLADLLDCAAYLRGYGAWDETELADHDKNLDRLVWLTGCALAEGDFAYFDRN